MYCGRRVGKPTSQPLGLVYPDSPEPPAKDPVNGIIVDDEKSKPRTLVSRHSRFYCTDVVHNNVIIPIL
jgi:hypothetical protein